MKTCKRCGEEYTAEELRELREMGEKYSKSPFLCPDCFDWFQRLDAEEQFSFLYHEEEASL